MLRTWKMKLSCLFGAVVLLFAGGALIMGMNSPVSAKAAPVLSFKAGNLVFEDGIYIEYTVSAENVDAANVQVLVWNEVPDTYEYGTQNAVLSYDETNAVEIEGAVYPNYAYKDLTAKQMTDDVYACVYAEVDGEKYYSKPLKYSILGYAYNKLGRTTATATTDQELKDLLHGMLEYGALAQKYFDYAVDRLATAKFVYAEVANAAFEDGFEYGLFLEGERVKVTPDEGYKLSVSAPSYFETDAEGNITLAIPEGTSEGFKIVETAAFIEETIAEEKTKEIAIVFSALGYENAANFTPYEKEGIAVMGTKVKYYDTGSALRVSAGGCITVSGLAGYELRSIKLTLHSGGLMTGDYEMENNGGVEGLGTTAVTITPLDGELPVTLTNTSSQAWRIQTITVTVAV